MLNATNNFSPILKNIAGNQPGDSTSQSSKNSSIVDHGEGEPRVNFFLRYPLKLIGILLEN
jgi:hypothetical protein